MIHLQDALENGLVLLDLEASDLSVVFHRTVERLVEQDLIDAEHQQLVIDGLHQREEAVSTAIGHAVSIPHLYLKEIESPIITFVRLKHWMNLGAPDGIPTRFFFFMLGPTEATSQHLDSLSNIARMMSNDELRYDVGIVETKEELLEAVTRFIGRTTPTVDELAKVEEEPHYTGKPAGGLIGDIKRRLPHYLTDFKDGIHPKCLGSILFLFFACLAPAVTFGGFMSDHTQMQIGTIEMLIATAICGVMFAFIGGQPLIVMGGTGPLLVITALLYTLCENLQIPFLPTYAWVGFWTSMFLILCAVTDASCLMKYFTRFTDEIFAALISLIFIYEAINSLILIFKDLDEHQQHDSALLSLLLALGTYFIATSLSRMRRSRFLRSFVREFLADFGPAIALIIMTIIAIVLHEVDLKQLNVPSSIGTTSGRPWMVNLFEAPTWVMFAAAGPALLVTILIFLNQNITSRLVGSKDHKLNRGTSYHWNLFLVGVLVACCSLFGLPWLVGSIVLSINHVRSLASMEEVVTRGDQSRERILHVRENRVTGIMVHILIALSLGLVGYIKMIPMAVLYGLFLFMGVVSMKGNQFFERFTLFFTDPALYPTTHYSRRVPVWTIHKFTLLQSLCLLVLWLVKASVLGILFPLFIALLVPVRFLANRFFKPIHLEALDADEVPQEEETHWAT